MQVPCRMAPPPVKPLHLSTHRWGTVMEDRTVPRILSGVQPTGNTHIGNYVGATASDRRRQDHARALHSPSGEPTFDEGLWPMAAEPGPDFRWGIVTRRSQLNRDGTEGSTARQERAIHEFIKAHNMGRVVAIYTDIASAYDERAKREDYKNALADLRAGRIDGLIAWKVDRFTRRRSEARRLLTLLEECGGRLATVVEGIDTADPAKREITEIALAIYAGTAESESEAIGERISLMHLDRARKGLMQLPGRPFGHTEDCRGLVPAEVKVLHEMGERVLAGEAPFSIARDLTRRRIPTARGNTRWHGEQVRRILTSARMVGKREYGGKLYVGDGVPPIFDEETWERICAAIKGRANVVGPRVTHLLSSIGLCDVCERTVSGHAPGKGKRCWSSRTQARNGTGAHWSGSGQSCGSSPSVLLSSHAVRVRSYQARTPLTLRGSRSSLPLSSPPSPPEPN